MIGGLSALGGVLVGWCIGEWIQARRYARLFAEFPPCHPIANMAAPTITELVGHDVVTDSTDEPDS